MPENIPLEKQKLDEIFNETGFNSENLSIRETNRLATIINDKHEIDFVRMERELNYNNWKTICSTWIYIEEICKIFKKPIFNVY